MSTLGTSSPGGWARPLAIGVAAGVAAAFIILVPVLILQEGRGVGVGLEFQLTASSLIGKAAYASTAFPVLVGVLLHLSVSIIPAVVFALAAWRVPLVNRLAWVSGPLFGAAVFFFMGLVILPLSAIAPPLPTTAMPFLSGLLIHMFGFGLPIALIVRRQMGLPG